MRALVLSRRIRRDGNLALEHPFALLFRKAAVDQLGRASELLSETRFDPTRLVFEPLTGDPAVEREERVGHVRRDKEVDIDSGCRCAGREQQ